MDKLKEELNKELYLLNYIKNQKEDVETNIIKIKQQLYNICPHIHIEKKTQYYDKTITFCLDCGYEI